MSRHTAAYKQFFDSPAGKDFLTFIHNRIDTEHETAENEADAVIAYGHSRIAKAWREVVTHINSVSAERKTED